MNIYDFIDECRDAGMTAREAEREYCRAIAEEAHEWEESYYDDPWVIAGAVQQDIIDMYRRER